MNKTLKFILVKLLVILIVTVLAAGLGIVAKFIVSSMMPADDTSLDQAKNVVSCVVMTAFFFIYLAVTVKKVKYREGDKVLLSLKETVPYIVFMIPYLVLGFFGSTSAVLFSNVAGWIYAPHMILDCIGLPHYLDLLAYVVAFFLVNLIVFVGKKAETVEESPENTDSQEP